MTTAVVARRGGPGEALAAAAGLVIATAGYLLAPVLGVVRTADGSAVWFAPGVLWLYLVPALLVAALALPRPVAALAVAAGSGLIGIARLLADLPIVLDPDSVARPDLFVETTDRSLPLRASGGAYLVLAADVMTLLVGVAAALWLAGRLSLAGGVDQRGDRPDGVHLDSDRLDGDRLDGDRPDGDRLDGVQPDTVQPDSVDALAAYQAERETEANSRGTDRNYLLTVAGFVGVLLLAIGALAVPYQGGYLAGRYLAVGVPLVGLVGAVVLAVLAAIAVLVGGSLPRTIAVGLLGGVALGACLPYLVAIASLASAPVHPATTVWLGLGGGVLLAAAGLLARTRLVALPRADLPNETITPPSPAAAIAAGACGIAAGGLCAAAFYLPPLDAGGLEDLLVLSDGSPVPGATLFGAAAIPLVVAGVLALVAPTARAGRAALMVLWAAAVPAVTGALQVVGDDGISTARLLGLVRIGSGTWCGLAGLVLAIAAAVLAAVTARRAANASPVVTDDESAAAARTVTVPVAVALGLLTVVAALLPVYGTSGLIQGPSLLHGYDVSAWGVWAGMIVTVGALAAAAVTRHRSVAAALAVAAAAVQAIRLVVPTAARGATGFGLRPGLFVQAVEVAALLVAALLLARAAGRVRSVEARPLGIAAASGASSPVGRRRKR